MTASSSSPFLYSAAAVVATTTVEEEAHLFQSPLGLAPLRTGRERNCRPNQVLVLFSVQNLDFSLYPLVETIPAWTK